MLIAPLFRTKSVLSGNLTRHSIPIVIIVLVTLLALIFLPFIPKSFAHAFVVNSNPTSSQSLPAPPSKIDLYFSEPVDLRYSKLSVLDSNGKQIDNKDIHNIGNDQTTLSLSLPTDLKDGVYTVTSKVLSQTDGHVTDNAFVFGIGEAKIPNNTSNGSDRSSFSSQLYIPDAVARFPALVGQVMIVGSAFATLWLWRPISKISLLKDSIQQTRKKIDRSMLVLTIIGSFILLASDFGIIFVQANSVNIGINEAISTKFGGIWIIRVVESFLLLAISLGFYRKLQKTNDNSSSLKFKKQNICILLIGILTLLTTSLIGHGAANGQLLPITIDFIHNFAPSLWIGGIIYLVFVVVPKIKSSTLQGEVKASILSILIPRFSTIPVIILGIIVVTGPLLLYILESNLDLTLASLYGKILIVKLSLAAIMIGIGSYNQIVVQKQAAKISIIAEAITTNGSSTTPLIDKTNNTNIGKILGKLWSRKDPQYSPKEFKSNKRNSIYDSGKQEINQLIHRFSRSTKAEAIVGLALLGAVAVLVNTGLPASEFQNYLQKQQQSANNLALIPINSIQRGFISTQFVENGSRIILSIDPFTAGNNNLKISFLGSNRLPIDIKSVQLEFSQTNKGIGPIKIDSRQASKGVFLANGAFGLPGLWDIQIEGIQNKPNSPNLVASFNGLNVKPTLDNFKFNVNEFKMPGNSSQPLYPLYDNGRNTIWVGRYCN